jgi:hypothetical protein
VLLMLRDAEIKHFHTGTGSGLAHAFVNTTPGVHDPVVAAAQMRPNNAHQAQYRTYPSRPFPKVYGAPIESELCLDIFGLSGHDAPWCSFLHPENIKDHDIKQRVLQFKVTHSMKQDVVPEKFKEAIQSRQASRPIRQG